MANVKDESTARKGGSIRSYDEAVAYWKSQGY
jgi:hypothetical protein